MLPRRSLIQALCLCSCLFISTPLSAAPEPLAEPTTAAAGRLALQTLDAEKAARSPARQKIDSRLLRVLQQATQPRTAADPRLPAPDAAGQLLLDIKLIDPAAAKMVIESLTAAGGQLVAYPAGAAELRAHVPLAAVEPLAMLAAVRAIRPADIAVTRRVDTSEGVTTHALRTTTETFGVTGAGVSVCVLSDGADTAAQRTAAGDLPPIAILSGQQGSGDEGTAMLEIIHDLAPGAALTFATAFGGAPSFAQNILALRSAGCQIIVDDVAYLSQSPFQEDSITDAVNRVVAAGAVYLTSAGNEGNLNDATAGVWEGTFTPAGTLPGIIGTIHSFDGTQSNQILSAGLAVTLHWAEPAGAATSDYDLYVFNAEMTRVVDSSTNIQNGDDDPFEFVAEVFVGERIVVVQKSGTARMLSVNAYRGQLERATAGQLRGHPAAVGALSVAAVDVATALPGAFTGGSANPVEPFSTDGPRRIFFDVNGSLLPGAPAGNFTATGGIVRQKPDIAAADGVSVAAPGFAPFFGTSAAAPHAAAIAALLAEAVPGATNTQIVAAMRAGTLDIEAPGVDRDSGSGIVMPGLALAQIGAVPAAVVTGGAPVLAPLSGDGDQVIEPGERWSVTLPLTNTGGRTANTVQLTLSSTSPQVSVGAAAAIGDLAPGTTSAAATVSFTLPAAFPCGAPLGLSAQISYQGGRRASTTQPIVAVCGSAGVAVTRAYRGAPMAIIDGGDSGQAGAPTIVPIDVTGFVGRIHDLDVVFPGSACSAAVDAVGVALSHTYLGDLVIELVSPAGTTVRLLDRAGGSGNNLCDTTLDDAAAINVQRLAAADAPYSGSYRPAAPLATFNGEDANGTWQLRISDLQRFDVGLVRSVTLRVTEAQCAQNTAQPNTVPSLTLPATQRARPATPLVFAAATGNALALADDSAAPQLMLSASAGTLQVASTLGVAVVDNGTGSVVLSGDVAALNRALDGLQYLPPLRSIGLLLLDIRVDDRDTRPAGALRASGQIVVILPQLALPTLRN